MVSNRSATGSLRLNECVCVWVVTAIKVGDLGSLPYSDSLGSVIMNQLYWRGTGRIYWRMTTQQHLVDCRFIEQPC